MMKDRPFKNPLKEFLLKKDPFKVPEERLFKDAFSRKTL